LAIRTAGKSDRIRRLQNPREKEGEEKKKKKRRRRKEGERYRKR